MNRLQCLHQLAAKEVQAHLKSGWIAITGLACAALSWFVGVHGFAFTGGQVQIETLLVSIVHLQLYTVPLLGLLLAYDAILGERESGMFDLHLSLGLDKSTFLVGKWVGLSLSLWLALLPGLAVQAWSLWAVGGSSSTFILLLVYAALLGGAVLSLGLLLSCLSLNRSTVVSLGVGVWLALAILLDFAAVVLLTHTQGTAPEWLVNALITTNPLGLYRLLSYMSFFPDQVEALLGVSGFSPQLAAGAMLAWTAAPAWIALRKLGRHYRPISREGGQLG
ncbi:MAG: ABC transporter permease subunit [Candidatus Latescibacteria bacterium]|nr:ABC transporter permease subunit [Candidatus Latescibacterota bacterium]